MYYATSFVLKQITPLLHLMNTRANGAPHALVMEERPNKHPTHRNFNQPQESLENQNRTNVGENRNDNHSRDV